eukprot:TRINITY_DN14811_c0_g1_i2.p1 TRINITY_DN14811_c0_g1~~TRINITY_DN14811_c0_g1_i2.p1  ORF type:complete len:170 (+),score=13.35 TRINITY_DN14811_c0_g1_i2:143-652(+)
MQTQSFALQFVGPIDWIGEDVYEGFTFKGKATTQTIQTVINPADGFNATISGVQAGARAFLSIIGNMTDYDQNSVYFSSYGNATFGHEANSEAFDLIINSVLGDGMITGDVLSVTYLAFGEIGPLAGALGKIAVVGSINMATNQASLLATGIIQTFGNATIANQKYPSF